MKSINLIIVIAILLIISISGCKKNTTNEKVNITLWNKPLPTIKQYIQGDWKWVKVTGGIYPDLVHYVNNGELKLNGDRVQLWGDNHIFITDTTINWMHVDPAYFSDSTYVMFFYAEAGYPIGWTINEIKDDTLITRDDAVDGQKDFFIKQ